MIRWALLASVCILAAAVVVVGQPPFQTQAAPQASAQPAARAAPRIFNSLQFSGQPALPFPFCATTNGGVNEDTSEPLTRTYARKWGPDSELICLDAEIPIDVRWEKEVNVEANVSKLAARLQWLKSSAPQSKIGLFGFPRAWQQYEIVAMPLGADNWSKAVAAGDKTAALLGPYVDYSAPELYSRLLYSDPGAIQQWRIWAITTIAECRRQLPGGKPVYPYLSYEYVPGGNADQHVWERVPDAVFEAQLEVCRLYADGCIVWGGWNHKWDPNAGFYKAMLKETQAPPANAATQGAG